MKCVMLSVEEMLKLIQQEQCAVTIEPDSEVRIGERVQVLYKSDTDVNIPEIELFTVVTSISEEPISERESVMVAKISVRNRNYVL